MIHTQNTATCVYKSLVVAALLLSSAAFSACAAKDKEKPELRPNIILLSIDDLRADHLGCYGYDKPTTPFLDQWAEKEAVLFENAYSTDIGTPPSHAAMMTGMFPLTTNKMKMGTGILGSPPTLWEAFREQGYSVMGIADTIRFAPQYGYDPSFKVFVHKGARVVFPAAQQWIQQQEGPYFLFLHVFDVHWPWDPHPPFKGKLNTPPTRRGREFIKLSHALEFEKNFDDYTSLEAVVDDYDEEIMELDSRIRSFFTFLKNRDDYDQTMICVVSDHGEGFYDHGTHIGHRGSMPYEEVTRIPTIIRFPEKAYTGRRSAPVSLLDLMPSMLDVAGVEIPDYLEGDSLVPLARGEVFPERPVVSRSCGMGGSVAVRFGKGWKFIEAPKVSVRVIQSIIMRTGSSGGTPDKAPLPPEGALQKPETSKAFKENKTSPKKHSILTEEIPTEDDDLWPPGSLEVLARFLNAHPEEAALVTKRIPTADALFNLIEDPKETRNVIEENPELAEKARTLIAQKRKQWQELIQRFNPEERSNPIELSDEEIEQLKSVGYLQ